MTHSPARKGTPLVPAPKVREVVSALWAELAEQARRESEDRNHLGSGPRMAEY